MKLLKLLLCLLLAVSAYGKTFKVALLAPEGTNWAKQLKKMGKEIKKATDGKVKLKFYFGGTQGDEKDVLRKIWVGQLHGGIFTGKTLGEINGDVRVMELPFTFFNDRQKAFNVMGKMAPFFNDGFKKKKFKNLGFLEIGPVYFVSQENTPGIDSLKGLKIWSWEGDKLVAAMIESLKLVSVPLALPDVLSSLSTGIIQAAYAPPLGILALQWNTKIKYLVNFPLSYSVGAFLLHDKAWKKVSPAHQKIIDEISKKYIQKVNEVNVQDNVKSLDVMKSAGIKFLNFPKTDIEKGKLLRKKVVNKLKGKLFSEEAYKLFNSKL